jgi:hypothetical protein
VILLVRHGCRSTEVPVLLGKIGLAKVRIVRAGRHSVGEA